MNNRADIIECPHCAEPTMPNRLSDGTLVCSCAAERPLPEPRDTLTERALGALRERECANAGSLAEGKPPSCRRHGLGVTAAPAA